MPVQSAVVERNQFVRVLILLLIAAVALHLVGVVWTVGRSFGDLIVMFFLAWLLAFILTPLVHVIADAARLPRALAAALVYVSLFVALLTGLVLLVPLLVTQLIELGRALPAYAERVPRVLAEIQTDLSARNIDVDITAVYRPQEISNALAGLGAAAVQNAVGILTSVFGAAFAVVLVLVLSFYMVVDGEHIERTFLAFIPDERRSEVDFFIDSVNRSFGGFLRGTVIQAVIYGTGTAVVMLIAGIDYVLISSIFAGIVMIVPVFGPFLAIIPPVAVAIISAPVGTVLVVVAGLLILQQITFNVIAPKVMSDSLGMHPLLVFAALLVGGRVAGLTGAIFGVPVAGVIWALFRHAIGQSRYGQMAAERRQASEAIARAERSRPDTGRGMRLWRRLGRRRPSDA
ncbi:MAG: AI-2E family transporter [Chloroflexota bacterium]|nr:MAG: AI-2E family transporter [Chloroflexota bacterium]